MVTYYVLAACNIRYRPELIATILSVFYILINILNYLFQSLVAYTCAFVQKRFIKSRLKLGNACYHSVQNLLSSRLLSKNLKIKIFRTIILPVVLYGCETWSLTLREERRLRVFEYIGHTVLKC
jgi:hypothetical protein